MFRLGLFLLGRIGRVDNQGVYLVHFVINVADQGEEGVDDGIQEAMSDPFYKMQISNRGMMQKVQHTWTSGITLERQDLFSDALGMLGNIVVMKLDPKISSAAF